jgi:rare lipoprotein A
MLQIGNCSFYGPGLYGNRTAGGDILRHNSPDLTAAHRSLPLGTMVKITRLDNHKSVTVRINDRGPYQRSIMIAVTDAAGKALGISVRGDGIVKVKIETTPETS